MHGSFVSPKSVTLSGCAVLFGVVAQHSLMQPVSPFIAPAGCTVGALVVWRAELRWVGWLILGFSWSLWVNQQFHARDLPPEAFANEVILTGVVVDLPEQHRGGPLRVRLRADEVRYGGRSYAVDVVCHLTWRYPPRHFDATVPWRFRVALSRPQKPLNPGGFDQAAWAQREGIHAFGQIRKGYPLRKAHPRHSLTSWRWTIRDRLMSVSGEHRFAGVLLALAIGDRQLISAQQWELLRDSGTAHLMAISGLHVGLMAAVGFMAGGWLWRRFPRLCEWVPAPRVAALSAMVLAAAYAALAGLAVPTQRALVMVVVVFGARLLDRSMAPWTSLTVALMVILFFDPDAVLDRGFWLSFAAVALIIVALFGRFRPRSLWWRYARAQWILAVGLSPLLLGFFHTVSLVSPLANVVAVPLVSTVVVPGVFLATVVTAVSETLGAALFALLNHMLTVLWWLLEQFVRMIPAWSPALWWTPLSALCAVIGVLLLAAPRGFPGRWLGAIWLSYPFTVSAPRPDPGEVWVDVFAVERGLALAVVGHRRSLIFLAGQEGSVQNRTAGSVLRPYLRHRGIRQVDVLIRASSVSERVGRHLKEVAMEIHTCRDRQSWDWEGVEFRLGWQQGICRLQISAGSRTLTVASRLPAVIRPEGGWWIVPALPLRQDVRQRLVASGVSGVIVSAPVREGDRWGGGGCCAQRPVSFEVISTAVHGAVTVLFSSAVIGVGDRETGALPRFLTSDRREGL